MQNQKPVAGSCRRKPGCFSPVPVNDNTIVIVITIGGKKAVFHAKQSG